MYETTAGKVTDGLNLIRVLQNSTLPKRCISILVGYLKNYL